MRSSACICLFESFETYIHVVNIGFQKHEQSINMNII